MKDRQDVSEIVQRSLYALLNIQLNHLFKSNATVESIQGSSRRKLYYWVARTAQLGRKPHRLCIRW